MEENLDVSNLTLDEQIAILIRDLPGPVQRFLQSPERNAVSLRLSQKYGLHADAAGVFEKAYIFMLLGIFTPDQFVNELREGGIGEETIKGLAADVNEQVFKKLREAERAGEQQTPRPQVPVMEVGKREVPPNLPGQVPPTLTPPAPAATQLLPTTPQTVPVMQPAAYVHPPVLYVAQPVYHAVPPAPIYSNPAPVIPAEAIHLAARTMAQDMQLAAQGYQGHAYQPVSQPAPVATPPPPQATIPPPAPQPVASPVTRAPETAPVRLTPVDSVSTNAPITKEYGTDPYREPIG